MYRDDFTDEAFFADDEGGGQDSHHALLVGLVRVRRKDLRTSLGQETDMLVLGMILLGLASFGAMLGFIHLCDRV